MKRCKECDQPQPEFGNLTLHLEDCPNHDETTCIVCIQEKLKDETKPS